MTEEDKKNLAMNAAYLGVIHSEHDGDVSIESLDRLAKIAVEYTEMEERKEFDYEDNPYDFAIEKFYLEKF
jgi:hypothetical protein